MTTIYPDSHEARPPVITVGRIVTTTPLDREDVSNYSLEVVAMDISGFPLNATTRIVIEVSDENDNTPQFSQPNATFGIPEETYDEENTLISEFPVS